jgi:protease PrsW
MVALAIALIPAIIIGFYTYFRDKYEKEPILMLAKGFLLGVLMVIPVLVIEYLLGLCTGYFAGFSKAVYDAFVVASLTEESLKYFFVYILIWKNLNFNEKFDGIVYAVFVSLGFASIENIMYVFSTNTITVGLLRAFTAVPFHAINGIIMGFYLGLAKFISANKIRHLIYAGILPFMFHGFYDLCLMAGNPWLILLWIPFLILIWRTGLKKMKLLNELSEFKNIEDNNASTSPS